MLTAADRVLISVASAVARAAMESGVAQVQVNIEDYKERLERRLAERRVALPRFDLERLRHSCAHVMATAILRLWPDAQFAAAHFTEQVGCLAEAGAGGALRIAGEAGGEIEPARRAAVAHPVETDPALVDAYLDLVLALDPAEAVGELKGVLGTDT